MNVYGPRQDYRGAYIAVIMKMLDAIDQGISPTIVGDGSETFDFISVDDCAKANICAMRSDVGSNYYNIGTGVGTSLKDLATTLLSLTDSDLSLEYVPRESDTFVKNRIGDPKKAKEEIGFTADIELKEGLRRLIEWRQLHKLQYHG